MLNASFRCLPYCYVLLVTHLFWQHNLHRSYHENHIFLVLLYWKGIVCIMILSVPIEHKMPCLWYSWIENCHPNVNWSWICLAILCGDSLAFVTCHLARCHWLSKKSVGPRIYFFLRASSPLWSSACDLIAVKQLISTSQPSCTCWEKKTSFTCCN